MKINCKNVQTISAHKYLRFDCKYWNTQDEYNNYHYIKLKEIFKVINGSVQTENYILEYSNTPYIRIGDLDYKYGIVMDNVIYLDDGSFIEHEKKLQENDIILATIGATVGKAGRVGKKVIGGTHSNNTVILRPSSDISTVFYEKVFQTDWFRKYIFGLVAQKAQPNLQPYEIENIKLPIVDEAIIKKAVDETTIIEKEIIKKNEFIKSAQKIIDSVFQHEFGFDYDKFEELKALRQYTSSQALFSNNPDLRFSAKFHRPAGGFVMKELTRISDKKIKHFISEPIVLGASVSPKDYDEAGEYYYISMATIKTWEFDESAAFTVSDTYSADKIAKSVLKNDILLARSGEGTIGKVAIITTEDVNGIFADFTMRIRLDSKRYNSTFAYYYMRSRYFQYLIEVYKKGLGNNTNIFPIVLQEFPIPDISLPEQQRIVDEIQAEINQQKEIQKEIADLRNQIDEIILQSISAK